MKRYSVVVVSGGFDPVHLGHIRLFRAAKRLVGMEGHMLVIANNDNWLREKRGGGKVLLPESDRVEVLREFRSVDEVVLTAHKPHPIDMSVCSELHRIRERYPNRNLIFANGGDRNAGNIPEYHLCEELGISMVFNIGEGGKMQSSSELLRRYTS